MTKGFPAQEFKTRVAKAQAYMAQQGLDAILLTTEPDVRYFTGYLTRFWEKSPCSGRQETSRKWVNASPRKWESRRGN